MVLRLAMMGALAGVMLMTSRGMAQIELPPSKPGERIVVRADAARHWKKGSYDVWLLEGHAEIKQGGNVCRGDEAVLWIKRGAARDDTPSEQPDPLLGRQKYLSQNRLAGGMPAPQGGFGANRWAGGSPTPQGGFGAPRSEEPRSEEPRTEIPRHKVIAYLEGNVEFDCAGRRRPAARPPSTARGAGWLGRFYSTVPVSVDVPHVVSGAPRDMPEVYDHGMARRDPKPPAVQRTQFTQPIGGGPAVGAPPPGSRRLSFFGRYAGGFEVDSFGDPGEERVVVIRGGVNLIMDGLPQNRQIDILADKLVLWTRGMADPQPGADTIEDDNMPLEVYMEGNVVFREDDRVVYADRMYFDVKQENGTVVSAEVLTPAPGYGGLLRLKAALIRIRGGSEMYARSGFVTSSRLARPGYRVQSREIFVEDEQIPVNDPRTGAPLIDPESGEQVFDHEQTVTAKHNVMFIGPAPVFYWPRFSTNLDDPSTLLVGAFFQQDLVFGFWSEAEIDAFQLLGIDSQPKGTDWTFTISDLTKRGYGGGTWFKLDRQDMFGIPGKIYGLLDVWGLRDKGFDNLGAGRSAVPPENPSTRLRGRAVGNFRWNLPKNTTLTGEFGFISDRNFLEEYYEYEWDLMKDQSTDLQLKQLNNNRAWSVNTDVRVNPFFTDTNWLPRGDHFMLGQSLLGDRLTYFEHSSAGYAQNLITDLPTDPQDLANFVLLPWEQFGNHQGTRFTTKHEVDAPFDLGPFKFVPYVGGELDHWDQNLAGNSTNRAWGEAGIRGSIPFWSANPNIESNLFNVHGIAHKMVFSGDASVADTNVRMTSLPLYDPLDDNAQELFRRRFAQFTYGGTTPLQFDPRFYALRAGIQNSVTSPVPEVTDRMAAARFGLLQRWQTKRGPPGQRRIMDWVVLDMNAVYFPNAARDNFGQSFGLVNYDFRWYVGDRVAIVSDAGLDFFVGGQRTFTIGATLQRSPRVNWFLGYNTLNGPFTYDVVTLTHSYQMSPKWLYNASTSFALQPGGAVGESVGLSRVGESFIMNVSFYVDSTKNNVGFNYMLTPRFLGPKMMQRINGAAGIPMAGANGLE